MVVGGCCKAFGEIGWDKLFPSLLVGMMFYVWHAQITDTTKQVTAAQINLVRMDAQMHEYASRNELSDGLTKLRTEQFQHTLTVARQEEHLQTLKHRHLELTARQDEQIHALKNQVQTLQQSLATLEGISRRLHAKSKPPAS
jgi:hypothetical protein